MEQTQYANMLTEQQTIIDFCNFLISHQFPGQKSDNLQFQEIVLNNNDTFPLLVGYSGCLVHAVFISVKRQRHENAFFQYLADKAANEP